MSYERKPRKNDVEKPNSGNKSWPTGDKLVWLSTYLQKDDVKWLQDNYDGVLDAVSRLFIEAGDGSQISVKPDSASPKFLATYISVGISTGRKYAVSIRGTTRIDALYALYYFVAVRYAWDLEGGAGSTDTELNWG